MPAPEHRDDFGPLAIAARQQRANAPGGEPKVAKFVDQIGTLIVGY